MCGFALWDLVRCGRRPAEIERTGAYFRWLSRDRAESWMNDHLPDAWRGAIEYGLERTVPRRPHMRWAVLRKSRD